MRPGKLEPAAWKKISCFSLAVKRTYLTVLRVANPFSTGSGVPVASPWESRTPILSTVCRCGLSLDDGFDGFDAIRDGLRLKVVARKADQ
jgi:hypothetical protein